MKDKKGGELAWEDAQIDAIFQEAKEKRYQKKFERRLEPRSKRIQRVICLAILAVVLLAFVLIGLVEWRNAYEHHPVVTAAPAPTTEESIPPPPVNWDDQLSVPRARLVSDAVDTTADTKRAFDQAFESVPYGLMNGQKVNIVMSQVVVVVAQRSSRPDAAYTFADTKGRFTTTCRLRAKGSLELINRDGDRVLASYKPPDGGTPSLDAWCTGDVLFYEQLK